MTDQTVQRELPCVCDRSAMEIGLLGHGPHCPAHPNPIPLKHLTLTEYSEHRRALPVGQREAFHASYRDALAERRREARDNRLHLSALQMAEDALNVGLAR
jgi:hypothetical protein